LAKQIWRDLKDFKGLYQVSNLGKVRSLNRRVYHSGNQTTHFHKGRILSSRINNSGYLSVRLSKEGFVVTRFVHRLIAEAFVPNLQDKPCVNHKDGNKLNNEIDNLEWVTHKENMQHAYKIGLIKKKNKKSLFNHTMNKIEVHIKIIRTKNEKNKV
jgi:hypothetical protein